jgi:hypothetical protein
MGLKARCCAMDAGLILRLDVRELSVIAFPRAVTKENRQPNNHARSEILSANIKGRITRGRDIALYIPLVSRELPGP